MQQSFLFRWLTKIAGLSSVLLLATSGSIAYNQPNYREGIINSNRQSSAIKAQLSSKIRPLNPNFACSNVNAVRVESWRDRDYWQAVNRLNLSVIRIPGGEGSSYWDWRKGGVINDLGDLPAGVSEFLDNKRDRAYDRAKLSDLQLGFTKNKQVPLFVLNLLSDDLESQLEMLREARDLGFPIKYIELGNEFYFPLDNYVAVFPQPKDYSKTANRWVAAIKKEFPEAKIAVLGVAKTSNRKSSRIYKWNREIVSNSLPFSNAITIHTYPRNGLVNRPIINDEYPFFQDKDISFILGEPFRNWQRISKIIATFPDNKKIWVTEYNLMEDIHAKSGEKQQRIAGSWIHGMYTLSMSLLFLEDPRIDLACNHMLIGSSQFSTILARENSFINPGKQDTKSQPLALSANGTTQKLFGDAILGMTQARKINFSPQKNLIGKEDISYPELYGWQFNNQQGKQNSLLLNLSSRSIEVDLKNLFPKTTSYKIIYGSPQDLVSHPDVLNQEIGNTSETMVLPPYSATKLSNN